MNEEILDVGRGCVMELEVKSEGSHAPMMMSRLGCQLWLTKVALQVRIVHFGRAEKR